MEKIKLRVLHIHVRKEYWELARQKIKFWEWREIKPYWDKILSKNYDLIYYYMGYSSKKRIFHYDGWEKQTITHKEFGNIPKEVYAISLKEPF